MLKERTIVALVNEEPGLLSLKPIDVELESVFERDIVLAAADDESVLLFETSLEGQCCLAFVIDVLDPVAHHNDELRGYTVTFNMYAHAMRLHYGSLAIDIDDKSRHVVALAVYEAVCVVVRVIHDADGATHVEGRLEFAVPEVVVDLFIVEREHSHGYRPNLKMSDGYKFASGSHYSHNLSFINILRLMLYCPREHPRMESLQAFLLAFLQIYLLIHVFYITIIF